MSDIQNHTVPSNSIPSNSIPSNSRPSNSNQIEIRSYSPSLYPHERLPAKADLIEAFKPQESTRKVFAPLNEPPASKVQFTIGEMTREFDITARTLRFYEEKDLIHPKRNGLERLYSRRDRSRLKLIIMGKAVGFSLEDIKTMLDLYDLGDGGKTQLKVAKDQFSTQIVRLEEQRETLEAAIDELKSVVREVERRLTNS